jgi:peroxiredoxin
VSPASVGEPAPPLDLPDLTGKRHRLGELRGRAVLIVFFRHAG